MDHGFDLDQSLKRFVVFGGSVVPYHDYFTEIAWKSW